MRRMTKTLVLTATGLTWTFALGGCHHEDSTKATPEKPSRLSTTAAPSSSATATKPPVAVPAAKPVASVPKPDIPAAARCKLKAKTVDDVWLNKFYAERPANSAGLTWLEARNLCKQSHLEMCTESQWARACGNDASLGTVQSWTATTSGMAGFVVRGGGDCAARTVDPGFHQPPARSVLCCTRSIGVRTDNRSKAFLVATSARLLKFEKALNRHNAASAAHFLDDHLRFFQIEASRERARSLFEGSFRKYPNQWVLHDICDISLQSVGDPDVDTWTARCTKLAYRSGELGVTETAYVFGGRKVKLRSLTEPRILRKWSPP